jgi:nucleoid-associated protein EbfC
LAKQIQTTVASALFLLLKTPTYNRHNISTNETATMKDLMGMMKQAQELQGRMQKMQEDMAALEVRGQSGGGLVMVMLDGKGTLKKIKVDPSLMLPAETEILEDLIIAATEDARAKVETQMQAKMAEVTGGLPMPPGLKLW